VNKDLLRFVEVRVTNQDDVSAPDYVQQVNAFVEDVGINNAYTNLVLTDNTNLKDKNYIGKSDANTHL